ncbi:hypothetical protein FRC17_003303 [Serendipita sp. 399]|nr:hypothetical protein FRC17_003303 [Serendipita sp. 399]
MDRSRKRPLEVDFPTTTPTKRQRTLSITTVAASQPYDDENVSIIADVPILQDIWDSLPAGVVYEIARLLQIEPSRFSKITGPALRSLRALNNKDGVKEIPRILGIAPEAVPRLMDEKVADVLDWEADSHTKGDGTCLDSTPDSKNISGTVTFSGLLLMDDVVRPGSTGEDATGVKNPIRLLVPRLSESCLFTRTGGSHRFFRLKIANRQKYRQDDELNKLWEFCCKPIMILGRLFQPFIEKNDAVWYYMVGHDRLGEFAEKENRVRRGQYGIGKSIRTLGDLIQWWIPLDENKDQLLAKLITRFHLGISDTRPGPLIWDVQVHDDIAHDDYVFTDGSGRISSTAARELKQKLFSRMEIPPSAYQIRISTAKGVVQVDPHFPDSHDPDDGTSPGSLVISRSMLKAIHGECDHKCDGPPLLGDIPIIKAAHFVVCVNREAGIRHPANLSKQLIPILCDQGVTVATIKELQEKDIMRIISSLSLLHTDDHLEFAKAIQVEANLIYRAQMEDPSRPPQSARFRGKSNTDQWSLEDVVPAVEDDGSNIVYASSNLCDYQKLYLAVISGFNIRSSTYFINIWKKLVRQSVLKGVADFRIQLERSCYAMIVPDFSGELPEGCISFTPPKVILDSENRAVDFKSGDVLVGRHPALLPTDIQKVKLADIPSLRQRPGIIFFSTHGKRPLADILSGGDYDGDEVILIWDQTLVGPFKNADLSLADKIEAVDQSFAKDGTTVEEFRQRLRGLDHNAREKCLAQQLLSSLRVPHLHGLYNSYYLKTVDKYGLKSVEARTLAQKCNMLLDAPKTSHRLLDTVKCEDDKHYNALPDPLWKERSDGFKARGSYQERHAGRMSSNIMNPLSVLSSDGWEYFQSQFNEMNGGRDTHFQFDQEQHKKLRKPYLTAKQLALNSEAIQNQLALIEDTVEGVFKDFRTWLGEKSSKTRKENQQRLYELNRDFILKPTQEECPFFWSISGNDLQNVKASYAYYRDTKHSNEGSKSGFPWEVAALPLLGFLAKIPIQVSYPTLARLTPHNSFTSNKS